MRNHVKEIKNKKQKPFDKLLILGTLTHELGVYFYHNYKCLDQRLPPIQS